MKKIQIRMYIAITVITIILGYAVIKIRTARQNAINQQNQQNQQRVVRYVKAPGTGGSARAGTGSTKVDSTLKSLNKQGNQSAR